MMNSKQQTIPKNLDLVTLKICVYLHTLNDEGTNCFRNKTNSPHMLFVAKCSTRRSRGKSIVQGALAVGYLGNRPSCKYPPKLC